jgi:hypothetical protein
MMRSADIYAEIGLIPHPIDIAKVYDRRFNLPPRSPRQRLHRAQT